MTDPVLLDLPVVACDWQTPGRPGRLRDALHPLNDAPKGAPVMVEFTLYGDEPVVAHRELRVGFADGAGGARMVEPHIVDAELARAVLLAITDPKLRTTLEKMNAHVFTEEGEAMRIMLTRQALLIGPAGEDEVVNYINRHEVFTSATIHELALLVLPADMSSHQKIEIIPEIDIILAGLARLMMSAVPEHHPVAFPAERLLRQTGAA